MNWFKIGHKLLRIVSELSSPGRLRPGSGFIIGYDNIVRGNCGGFNNRCDSGVHSGLPVRLLRFVGPRDWDGDARCSTCTRRVTIFFSFSDFLWSNPRWPGSSAFATATADKATSATKMTAATTKPVCNLFNLLSCTKRICALGCRRVI